MFTPILASIGRLYPFYSGNYRLVNSAIGRKLAKPVEGNVWCKSPGGKLLVPLDDEVGRCIYFTGDYDKKLTWLCRKLARPGDTVMDIGANLGLVTLTLARCVGPSGRVHAFEPNPVLQSLLSESLLKNSISNVELHRSALGSANGETELTVPAGNAGQGSLRWQWNYHDSKRYPCVVERLCDVVSRENISTIRLIKIDVEGFEKEVLLGASDVLKDIRPHAIILEINEQNMPPFRDRDVVKILKSFSYEFLAIPRAIISMTATPFDSDKIDDPGHDVIAVPKERFEEIKSQLSCT